jgi:hypothetical protein
LDQLIKSRLTSFSTRLYFTLNPSSLARAHTAICKIAMRTTTSMILSYYPLFIEVALFGDNQSDSTIGSDSFLTILTPYYLDRCDATDWDWCPAYQLSSPPILSPQTHFIIPHHKIELTYRWAWIIAKFGKINKHNHV